jgi:hypothetical protein
LKATPAREAKKKVMLLVCFDSEGIVHHKYATNGQTFNKEFYLEVLRHLRESVYQKGPEKWWDGNWILHHGNVPTHTSHSVNSFLNYRSVLVSCMTNEGRDISV